MNGTEPLITSHPQYRVPTCSELAAASTIWGITLGFSAFGVIRAVTQTFHHWRRVRRATAYVILIWTELIASTVIAGLAWGYVRQSIRPNFAFFTVLILLWCLQIHAILQIILTRLKLIADDKSLILHLQWAVFIIVLAINISVACLWVPAWLHRSQRYIHINEIWARVEKSLFALIDLFLNGYFVYLVYSTLVSYGLTKYERLYRINVCMIIASISVDILIISMMSLRNPFLYVCFHPLAYLVKLHIEMSMSDLIAKTVKASRDPSNCRRCSDLSLYNVSESTQGWMAATSQRLGRVGPSRWATTGRGAKDQERADALDTPDTIQQPKGAVKNVRFWRHEPHLLPPGTRSPRDTTNGDDPELAMDSSESSAGRSDLEAWRRPIIISSSCGGHGCIF
ncbi:uncharacterized protein F5Z01DRAFT_484140 [Emericellopsis atlantica]|uniref:Integral membrane protein n=1 Tax=Emericellopsis atlantica TaxID=2614577 RepID=A0A9P8CRU6_9HYPO|nr:uncharacterized protein F5Z01DRAFT_484140 [Emericellopsis atlantica]KAG9256707.1 hypothetical protein F5Z01DRAFT_484140 [Emericellopsis atlantica]